MYVYVSVIQGYAHTDPTLNYRIAPAACEHKAATALLLLLVS